MTSVLGGAGTVVASYLARSKGTGELDICKKRVSNLKRFNRECEAFIKDYGDVETNPKNSMLNYRICELRNHFEMLLGNFDK